MNNNFNLFESSPFLEPLNEDEAKYVERLLQAMTSGKIHTPQMITDDMLMHVIKTLHETENTVNEKNWLQFIETLFLKGLEKNLNNHSLRNYLLIELAKKHQLSRFIDHDKRIELAYTALHGSIETRQVLLSFAKHFEINDNELLLDLAFKGLLLGGTFAFDLHQFMPQKLEIAKQFIFMIEKIDKEKAKLETDKLAFYFPFEANVIKQTLLAS